MPPVSESASGSPSAYMDSTKRRGKKRIRAFTTDERASHRVIEKQRREALNESFLVSIISQSQPPHHSNFRFQLIWQDLARLVPALAPVRRLSKSLIVHEGIQHLRAQRAMCLAVASEIQAILAENIQLIVEVNSWREQYGSSIGLRQVKPVGDAVLAILKVDQEVFGTFPGGFGDNGTGDDHDGDGHGAERPQMEERSDSPLSFPFRQGSPSTSTNKGFNLPEQIPIHPHSGSQSFHPDANHLIGIPDNLVGANGSTAQQTMLPDVDPFSFLDDGGYELSLVSNMDAPPISSSFADLNMHRDMLHDLIIAPPQMRHYIAPTHDEPNLGYML